MKPIIFYQSSNLTYEEIKEQFVVRQNEFERIMSTIEIDDMTGSIQHYIFVGQRGSGKSTLLRRIQAEINTQEKLSSQLIAINLSEEQAGVYRLYDLWERVTQELSHNHGFEVEDVTWETYGNDLTGFARALYHSIQAALQKQNKKLVLLLDNIDRILENIKEDKHLLRELLTNHKDVRIIGGSTRLSEHHWKYDEPFYQFFSIIRLEALTQEELRGLLSFWADHMNEPALSAFVQKHPGRLNAVRILTDGMPRTMLNFVELLINKPDQYGYEYLRAIIDRATPIYQERLMILSPLHQKIVLEMSFFWDAVKVKQLSQAARVESKTLSAALAQLVEQQIVEKIPGRGKNFMYRLRERFFNLWLVMTQGGPKQKSQVKWLTIFLETWYDNKELKNIYIQFSTELASGNITADRAIIMTKALVHSKCLSVDERDFLLEETNKLIVNRKEYTELLPEKSTDIYKRAMDLLAQDKLDEAHKQFETIEQDSDIKLMVRGLWYITQNKLRDAERVFLSIIKSGNKRAYFLLANLYSRLENFQEAERAYLLAVDENVDEAKLDLAKLYEKVGDIKCAEKYYLLAIEKKQVFTIYEVANFYNRINNLDNAEKYYLEALKEGESKALIDLGAIYAKKEQFKIAEKYYLLASKKGYVESFMSLVSIYLYLNDDNNAQKFLHLALEANVNNAELDYLSTLYAFNKNKEQARRILDKEHFKNATDKNHIAFIKVAGLWAGNIDYLEGIEDIIEYYVLMGDTARLKVVIQELLIQQQKNLVKDLFNHARWGEKLKEMIKPLYFVTLQLFDIGDFSEELTAQAPELKTTTNEIYSHVVKRQYFYYGKQTQHTAYPNDTAIS